MYVRGWKKGIVVSVCVCVCVCVGVHLVWGVGCRGVYVCVVEGLQYRGGCVSVFVPGVGSRAEGFECVCVVEGLYSRGVRVCVCVCVCLRVEGELCSRRKRLTPGGSGRECTEVLMGHFVSLSPLRALRPLQTVWPAGCLSGGTGPLPLPAPRVAGATELCLRGGVECVSVCVCVCVGVFGWRHWVGGVNRLTDRLGDGLQGCVKMLLQCHCHKA